MCCCDQPNVNGQPGYKWQPSHAPSVRPVSAPDLAEGDTLLIDEPGRCGGIDSHSHHYRLVRAKFGMALLVRHGGGDQRIDLSHGNQKAVIAGLLALDSTARYWILNSLFYADMDAKLRTAGEVELKWRAAASEKRIKTRKRRGVHNKSVDVWIEPAATSAGT